MGIFLAPVLLALGAIAVVRLRNRNIPVREAEIIQLRPAAAEDASAVATRTAADEPSVEAPEDEPEAIATATATPEPEVAVEPEQDEAAILEPVAARAEQQPTPAPPIAEPPAAEATEPESAEEVPAEAEGQSDTPDAEPAAPETEEFCHVAFWRGYLKAGFFARAIDEEGLEVAVAESPLFRAQGNGIPEETEKAVAAYKALVEQLKADGWEPAEKGEAWFDTTFRRELV
jgi:hypothetical protein